MSDLAVDMAARNAMPTEAFLTWLETYRAYSGPELDARILELKQQISIFSSQSVGSKNFTRDLAELRDQLGAATRARTEKGQINVPNSGTTDFSRICVS
jgi:hypothetical protein